MASAAPRLGLALAVAITSAATVATYARIRSDGRATRVRPADALLLFGAAMAPSGPSLALRTRTQRAAELHGDQLAPVVICSGTAAETEWMGEYLTASGVPAAALAVEPAASTRETVAAALDRLGPDGTAIAVTSYYHMHRVLDEARRVGLSLVACPTQPVGPRSLARWAHAHRSIAREVAAVWFYRLAAS